jgi:hypothetical protein
MKLYLGKDHYGDRGFFLAEILSDNGRFYYNKNTKMFEVNNNRPGVKDDKFYFEPSLLSSILDSINFKSIEVSGSFSNSELLSILPMGGKRQLFSSDDFVLGGAL